MGRDKSLLMIEDKSLIARIAGVLQGCCDDLLIISNARGRHRRYGLTGTREISDIYPGMGPLAGIHAGLRAAAHEYSIVAACDLPFITEPLIELLLERSAGYDVTVPRMGEYLEPLLAVYAKSCLPYIEDCLQGDRRKVTAFYSQVRVNYVDEGLLRTVIDPERAFLNINTPGDYRKLDKLK